MQEQIHQTEREGYKTRIDFLLISEMIDHNARVLDIGCGDGQLLALLEQRCHADARGMELSQKGVNACVAKGLSVIQGDADIDLADYPDQSFDYVILSQTIQATRRPRYVIEHMLRIGKKAIVSFPNFGHWRIRCQLGFFGRMPVTENLSYAWYDTPNIHFCTIRDFAALVEEIDAHIVRAIALDRFGQKVGVNAPWWFWNLFGEQAVFVLERMKN